MEINLLDMGMTKYGDSILITNGDRRILIDCGHPGDSNSIRMQLKKLLGQDPPFDIDLFIITHCHVDHIGCSPDLIKLGDIKPKMALLADEKLGFGSVLSGEDAISDGKRTLRTALAEEDHSDLEGDEMEQFLFDAANLQSKYHDTVAQLKNDLGDNAMIFTGIEDNYAGLEEKFKDFGLKILGPTKAHLKICGDYLAKGVAGGGSGDNFESLSLNNFSAIAKSYKAITAKSKADLIGQADMIGPGAAKNDESIVVSVENDGLKALLTGDMQFGVSEMAGLNGIMQTLLDKVNAAGPYDFIKFAHHTSYNGLGNDGHVLDTWLSKGTSLYAHSGGLHDTTHPDPNMLKILTDRKDKLFFARTDRNGIITVRSKTKPEMLISKGDFNDFSANKSASDEQNANLPQVVQRNAPTIAVPASPQPIERVGDEVVEVITKVPHVDTKVTVTIEIEKKKLTDIADPVTQQPPNPEPPGRLNNLLFVTCSAILKDNIGQSETAGLLTYLSSIPNATLLDLPQATGVDQVASLIRPKLKAPIKGVVILGGYDVIPPVQLDVLTQQQRTQIANDGHDSSDDVDNFIVYSDDVYGDSDNDLYPEFPVSRIPDGRKALMLMTALQAPLFKAGTRFGIRNLARPFAALTYQSIPGPTGDMNITETFNPASIQENSALGAVYYMLHGADSDATRFWGETAGGAPSEAVRIDNVPKAASGTIVFSGCCWGALSALPTAANKSSQTAFRPRSPEQSIALSYLAGGANAFVGCTGSHYSPDRPPYNYFGKPMHDEFWKGIVQGKPPALALFEAKKAYAAAMPHGLNDSFSKAIELKILREYTCLGIGW